jgi:hypothetical protein
MHNLPYFQEKINLYYMGASASSFFLNNFSMFWHTACSYLTLHKNKEKLIFTPKGSKSQTH